MRPVKIEWIVADEQRDTLQEDLEFAICFAPRWLDLLTVRYDPAEEHLASTSPSPEYRNASIRLGNGLFSEDREERRCALLHEVLHGQVSVLAQVFDALLDAAIEKDSALHKWACEQWRQAEEACICDLSRRIVEAFPG